MNKNIGILGGDLRIIFLSQMLAKDGYKVYTYGIEKADTYDLDESIVKCETQDILLKNCDNIISGIPFSKDGIYINAPFSDNKILIDAVFSSFKNKSLIAGSIKQDIKEKGLKNEINIIDLMEDEALTILNVIPTVEGALQVAMENTSFTIHGSKCLVLGFGRIGKLLSKTLKNLGANVGCMARKQRDLAWIKACCYKDIYINDLSKNLNDYDIIFNTIPALILDDEKLKILKDKNNNVTIIELASKPGGIDTKKAKEYNLKVIDALGLPGKVAPFTSAKYIKQSLDNLLDK